MLGIGIDDMFVIVQCLSNVEDSDPTFRDKKIDVLVGETLKHAGVAITITSFTDFVVLIVGTITVSRFKSCVHFVFPALKHGHSKCLKALLL